MRVLSENELSVGRVDGQREVGDYKVLQSRKYMLVFLEVLIWYVCSEGI